MRPVQMSHREADVLAALGDHLTNAQIAGRLHLSVRTVEGHVSSLLRKYAVADRRALAELAQTATGDAAVVRGGIAKLPAHQTSLVGREAELDLLATVLGESRLVTLSGPGGVGKTRLAVAAAETVADEFPFGGAFVDLVPAGSVVAAVAAALGVSDGPQHSVLDGVLDRLRRGRCLLVLDNCEQVIDDVAEFADNVLASCPKAVVLTTSRERLGLMPERVLPVEPLPVESDAARLFADRAGLPLDAAADTEAQTVQVCRRLDGLPLAIELAAARVRALGVDGLLAGLDDHLRLLAGGRGRTKRHGSLRAALTWSYDLLEPSEQSFLRRLSVFAGSFDLATVVRVTGEHPAASADLLGRLVDKSLLVPFSGSGGSGGGGVRWRLLATVRAFAAEHLADAGGDEALRRQHRDWAASVAAEIERELDAGRSWRDEFAEAGDDLWAAASQGPDGADRDPTLHALTRTLARLAHASGFLSGATRLYARAAERAPTTADAVADLRAQAECAHSAHDTGTAFRLLLDAAGRAAGPARASALARAIELAGRCPATFDVPVPRARLHELFADAVAAHPGGGPTGARGAKDSTDGTSEDTVVSARLAIAKAWLEGPAMLNADEKLARQAVEFARATGDPLLVSAALDAVRHALLPQGRAAEVLEATTERLTLAARMSASDPLHAPELEDLYANACYDQVAAGDIAAAAETARVVLDNDLHGDYPHLSASAVLPAIVLAGDLRRAAQLGEAMWESWNAAGHPPAVWLPIALPFVGLAQGLLGDPDAVPRWAERAEQTAGPDDFILAHHTPIMSFAAVRVAIHANPRPEDADVLVEETFALPANLALRSYALAAAAELATVTTRGDAAGRIAAAEADPPGNAWAKACLMRARARLDDDAAGLAAAAAEFSRIGARFEYAATLMLLPDRRADALATLADTGLHGRLTW